MVGDFDGDESIPWEFQICKKSTQKNASLQIQVSNGQVEVPEKNHGTQSIHQELNGTESQRTPK